MNDEQVDLQGIRETIASIGREIRRLKKQKQEGRLSDFAEEIARQTEVLRKASNALKRKHFTIVWRLFGHPEDKIDEWLKERGYKD